MRLKYEPGTNGEFVIRVKEEPVAYYDECTIDKLGNFVQRLSAYYSEKGELVEIRIYTGDLEKGDPLFILHGGIEKLEESLNKRILPVELKKGFEKNEILKPFPDNADVMKEEEDKWRVITDKRGIYIAMKEHGKLTIYDGGRYQRELEKEVMIPDVLPARRYVFLYDEENGYPKGCVDSFKEIWDSDDRWAGRLTMWRLDGKEMNKNEIWELRKEFLNDVFEWGYIDNYFVESVYRNKKLYFWEEEHTDSFELLDCVEEIYEELGYEIEESKERDLGADLIVRKENEKLALICICYEGFIIDETRVIKKEELIEVCRNTNEYENRVIILDSSVLSEEAIEYAKSNNIKVRGILELIRERNMEIAERNDDNPEYVDDIVSEIFGED